MVQLPRGYRATTRRQFTLYHQVPRNSWYSFDRPRKDERLSRPWSRTVVLNTAPLDWESSALITRPHEMGKVEILCGSLGILKPCNEQSGFVNYVFLNRKYKS